MSAYEIFRDKGLALGCKMWLLLTVCSVRSGVNVVKAALRFFLFFEVLLIMRLVWFGLLQVPSVSHHLLGVY